MTRLEDHIDRILGESWECLTAVEITLRLNTDFGDSEPYTPAEIEACVTKCRTFAEKEKNIAAREDAHQKTRRLKPSRASA
jgi:hypothetical protein